MGFDPEEAANLKNRLEIAASTASYDLEKLQVYRCNRVQEYLVWQVSDRIFDWFRFRDGEYIKLQSNKQNIIKSEVLSWLMARD